jgi:phage portal protein BeeE
VRTVHRLDGRTIDADDLWRFRLYPAGTPAGLDPIGYAAETIGQALAAQCFGATFFADSAIPSMALVSDQWDQPGAGGPSQDHVGTGTQGKRGTAVLGNGLNPKPLTVPPEASMFLETQRFGLQSVAHYFGVPPEMIGSDSGNPKTYASLERRNQGTTCAPPRTTTERDYGAAHQAARARLLPA